MHYICTKCMYYTETRYLFPSADLNPVHPQQTPHTKVLKPEWKTSREKPNRTFQTALVHYHAVSHRHWLTTAQGLLSISIIGAWQGRDPTTVLWFPVWLQSHSHSPGHITGCDLSCCWWKRALTGQSVFVTSLLAPSTNNFSSLRNWLLLRLDENPLPRWDF